MAELGVQMQAEMAEQPAVLAALAARRGDLVSQLRAALPSAPVGVVLVARGSSDNAAVYGRYVIEMATGRPVALAAPSLHTLYGTEPDVRGYVAVAVSQSGRTPEITTVLERLRATGAVTIAVTNEADSPLARGADAVVALEAGHEQAVPATKTFTAQVAAFAVIAEALAEAGGRALPWSAEDWAALPDAVALVLDDLEPATVAAQAIDDAPGIIAVGRGLWYGTALEAALKLKETTSILAEGYSAADLRHGPIAVVEREFPVLAFSAPGPAAADMADLCRVLRERGARVLEISPSPEAALRLPDRPAEGLLVVPATVRAQQVALELSRLRGLDPDQPIGLSKVTATH